jgi:hypothetical protein
MREQIDLVFPRYIAPYATPCHILLATRHRRRRRRRRRPWYLYLSLTETQPRSPGILFRSTVGSLKAVGELLAMLVGSVVRKQLLARGALEGLEAGFALDGLGRGVLHGHGQHRRGARSGRCGRTDLIWLLATGPESPLRSRFCCALWR